MPKSLTAVRQVARSVIFFAFCFALTIPAPRASANPCPWWLATLARGAQNLSLESGASLEDIAATYKYKMDTEGAAVIEAQQRGYEAFAQPDSFILKGDGLELVKYQNLWFKRDPMVAGSETNVPMNELMRMPEWRDHDVRQVFESIIGRYTRRSQDTADRETVAQTIGHKPYYFLSDVNGLKFSNEAVPTASYAGMHASGDAVLRIIGETLSQLTPNGIVARSSGADEIRGILFFNDDFAAMRFVSELDRVLRWRIDNYINEQVEHFESLYQKTLQADNTGDFQPQSWVNKSLPFEEARQGVLDRLTTQIFRLKKDRPSLSVALAQIGPALREMSENLNLSPLELVEQKTDAKVEYIKVDYKKNNGLVRNGAAGAFQLGLLDENWVPPGIARPITFTNLDESPLHKRLLRTR